MVGGNQSTLPSPCTAFSQSLSVNSLLRLDHVARNALAARNNDNSRPRNPYDCAYGTRHNFRETQLMRPLLSLTTFLFCPTKTATELEISSFKKYYSLQLCNCGRVILVLRTHSRRIIFSAGRLGRQGSWRRMLQYTR